MEVIFMQRYSATQLNSELFWKFPKFLSENRKYADLTNDDRVAYMLIKDRYRYSLSHKWIDQKGDVYVFFTGDELQALLHVGKNKVTRIKKRLIDAGLLEIEKDGFDPKTKKNYPDRIYLLQPEYNAEDLISQSSQVGSLEQSDFPKMGTRDQNAGNIDNTGNSNSENCNKDTSSLEQSDFPKMGTDKDKNYSDTNIDTSLDTDNNWDFSKKNYSKELVEKQNQDLLHHLGDTLANDSIPMFLDKETLDLIGMWFRTPSAASDCISTILNAANDSRENAVSQIGRHRLEFEDYQGELKTRVRRTHRRCLNRVRVDEDYNRKGKIKNFKNYLYGAMRQTFDHWQNDVLMEEKKTNKEK